MNRERCEIISQQIHQEFYRQVTLNEDYKLVPSRVDILALRGFLDYLDTSYGLDKITIEYLVNWFESGWNFWYDHKSLKYGTGSIQLSWIVGKKAIERYEKIKDKDDKFFRFNRKIRQDVGVSVLKQFKVAKNKREVDSLLLNLNEEEEQNKKKYHNKEEGQMWCAVTTTLYNHKSNLCRLCIGKNNCKSMLMTNMPNLYRKRGYETLRR